MQEYHSSTGLGKKVRRKIRKKYKRYKYGLSFSVILALSLIAAEYILWCMLAGEALVSRLMLCIGAAVIPFIVILSTVLVTLSGGAEMPPKRSERVVISEDSLLYEFVPDERHMPGVSLVVYKYNWNEVTEVVQEPEHARITILGSGYFTTYSDICKENITGNKEEHFVCDLSVTLYDNFADFEKIRSEILNKLERKKQTDR